MQFILESILPLFLHPSLSFSRYVVTRGIMGLSYSRQDVDALSSNIKWFPAVPGMFSSLPFSCLTGLEGVHAMNHGYSPQPALASHTCILCKVVFPLFLSFFLPTKAHAALSCSVWSRCHHCNTSLSCSIRPCVSWYVFALTPHQRHSQLPQCIITMSSGQEKRPTVMWKGNYLWWNLLKQIGNRRGGQGESAKMVVGGCKKCNFLCREPVNRLMGSL